MITVTHIKCGQPAFYFKERLHAGDHVTAENTVMLDGSEAQQYSPIICGSCHERIPMLNSQTVVQEDQHWTDWFLLEEDKWKRNRLL